MPLPESYAMSEEERRQRQAFLGISAADADNVRALRAAFAKYSRAFAERFYEHLLSHPETAALLRYPKQLEQLKALQARYFGELLDGVFDAAYFEGHLITPDDLPDKVVELAPAAGVSEDPRHLRAVERRHVREVLDQLKGNRVQAARALAISRRALYRLLDKHLE